MCSTNSPLRRAHCFSFLQSKDFLKPQLVLLNATLRSRVSECARPAAPVQGPTVSVFRKPSIFIKPQPVALIGI